MDNPIEFAHNASVKDLVAFLKKANTAYRNTGKPIVTDDVYDAMIEILEERDPDNKFLQVIGDEVIDPGEKVKLKFHMGSMDKIKNADMIQKWLEKHPGNYIVSDKLDGNSGMLTLNLNKDMTIKKALYSRGNGTFGRDITHLLEHIYIPSDKVLLTMFKELDTDEITVRGELIISNTNFKQFSSKYSSPRNFVNSILNSKDKKAHQFAKYVDYLIFDIIQPNQSPESYFKTLNKFKFKIPGVTALTLQQAKQPLTFNKLLDKHRKQSDYEMDGIIVTLNQVNAIPTSGNPKHSFAFKSNPDGTLTQIVNVNYNTTKHGKLNPVIEFKPVNLQGSVVKHANGHSAKYIFDNKINVGTVIKVVLSGGVIPYITEIVASSKTPATPPFEYYWDKTHTHIYMKNPEESATFNSQRLISSIKTLGIPFVSGGIVNKLVENGHDSLKKILSVTKQDLLQIPGFKEKSSEKIVGAIKKVTSETIKIEILMTASLVFENGISTKKFALITSKYPNLLRIPPLTLQQVKDIPGFAEISAKQFVEGYPKFLDFLKEHPMLKPKRIIKVKTLKKGLNVVKKNPLKIVITGVRDKGIQEYIELNEGKVQTALSKDTNFLIVKEKGYENKKTEKAAALNIPVISVSEFKSKFNIH